jgi:phage gpG-like protein
MSDEGIQGLSRLLDRVAQMATDTRHVERPLKSAGAYMLGSVQKNFQSQGRPQKWTPLAPSTLAARRKGRGRGGPQILIDTARMKNQIGFKVHSAGVEVGLNAVQAKRQHFGYPGGTGRGHSKTPARPFLLIQEPEDVIEVGKIFRRHIARR